MKPRKESNTFSTCYPRFQSAMSFFAVVCCCGPITVSAILVFDTTALLNEVLIPADAAVGSVIYRLRASDTAFDYPLTFDLKDSSAVAVEALNCTRFNSVCQANLILKKKLEPGRFYDFKVEVRNQRGQVGAMNCSFQATNATTPTEKIFPGAPTILTVSEGARRNRELGTLIAKGNPHKMKAVYIELYGTVQFGIHQKLINEKDAQGTIVLLAPLDYETKAVHHLTILANDPWTNINEDTRNIAGWPLLVAVIDEQDTPPVFTIAPPTTTLSHTLEVGDTILRVHAEDGDRGQPRPIRYSLDPEDSASSMFQIDEQTGDLKLAVPVLNTLSLSNQGQPILLKVTAEEVRQNSQEAPSQSSTVQLALIPPGKTSGSPIFGSMEYHALLEENAPVGTILELHQAEITTEPGDVITLELTKNNGTFEIIPSVVEGFAEFRVIVHDNRLLDYEARHQVECYIVAKELGKGNYTARAKLNVFLIDVNDNPPQFVKSEFTGMVPEHANVGTTVLVVEAADVHKEPGSKVKYLDLVGPGSEIFSLDQETGLVTVANSLGLDAETRPQIKLEVRAADENGKGLIASADVMITVLDINDNAPQFDKDVYEFILNTDRISFTTQAFVKAFDSDILPPNNEVKYQLLTPNEDLFLNEDTGELLLKKQWQPDDLVSLKVRAYDNGVPRLSSDAEIRVYPPESKTRKMLFIVPEKYPDKHNTEKTLSELTGGKVVVEEIRPYTGYEPGATYVTRDQNGDKSVVVATVHYTKDSVVDINRIQQLLDDQNQQPQTINRENQQNTIIKEREQTTIKQSSSGDLLWLLILFIVLAILAAIILILCCICRPCPLYIPPKRKRVRSSDVAEKLVVKGSGHGRETKSVQVAEWFGRKEAWSAEKEAVPGLDAEIDSLRRHEMERGSDRGGIRQPVLQQQRFQQTYYNPQEAAREHLYYREGNADILRLVTRAGSDPQHRNGPFAEHSQGQPFLVDSGKDILMRRFIDQQQAEASRAQVLLPNAVSKLQTEQEFLEASLRQQNALLRQLILDKERDLKLETQSLPAGTQTDQDMSTQTEPQYLRPPRRRVQSDWELSDDGSDEEIAIIKARAKRRHRIIKPRKIRTPILEESEVEVVDKYETSHKQTNIDKGVDAFTDTTPKIKQTRTSQLRQRRANSETFQRKKSKTKPPKSKSALRREVLKEISASLDQSEDSDNSYRKSRDDPRYSDDEYSEDSLEDISPRSEQTIETTSYSRQQSHSSGAFKSRASGSLDRRRQSSEPPYRSPRGRRRLSTDSGRVKQRYSSEIDLRMMSAQKSQKGSVKKSQSQIDLSSARGSEGKKREKKSEPRRVSRYMEWYTKKQKPGNEKPEKPPDKGKTEVVLDPEKIVKPMVESRLFKETVSSSGKKVDSVKKSNLGPEHPLLQHSEHRFECQFPKKRPEEDADSGIVLTKPEMALKKSIFTIAYNDVHTKQLRPDSSVNTP